MKRRDPAEDLAFAIRAETASALGKTGRQLKRAIAPFADYYGVADGRRNPKHRERLLRDAAEALHATSSRRSCWASPTTRPSAGSMESRRNSGA